MMLGRLSRALRIFKHDFRGLGTGLVYGQKSGFYECRKCRSVVYIPIGMEDMLISRGCDRK